ncbi:hypothetical protein PybrP1_003923 [[Pythium] brassicae (nom. inval.)]|nr:hypothetical protein PybrP1_003923 [[Pythium] brassicae (nom. inval.)]
MTRFSIRKLLLFTLNLASTLLTLFTGLRENPLVVFTTGRYDLMQARTGDGSLNYRIVSDDLLEIDRLADLSEVGKTYRFFSAPARGPHNLGNDRSNCLKINSMNVSVLNIYYEDMYGHSNRRTQVYTFSISAPKCEVVNFKPDWVKMCISSRGNNETACNQYILDNFESLAKNRLIRRETEVDFGANGAPYLKCRGRPTRTFDFTADLILHQSYWAGGTYYVLFLTSDCLAQPQLQTSDREWGLFKIEAIDKLQRVVGAIDNNGWFTKVVTFCYGIVSISMIIMGVFSMVVQSREVFYIPSVKRFQRERRLLKYVFPSMGTVRHLTNSSENVVVRFKGNLFMASDVWMNHWLYIWLSILDSLVNLRMTYYIFQMGTWMLSKKLNMENFIFMCSALTRLTWILCLAHTLLRWGLKIAMRSLKAFKFIRPALREKLEWYVDASALFVSYKIYSILLFVFLYILLVTIKATTFMVRKDPKRGVFGGSPKIAQFWKSELACDLFVFIPILLGAGFLLSTLVMLTKYKYIANNRVVKLLQHRYVVVGWDVLVAMEALGIDPLRRELRNEDEATVTTNCSIGALLQQLYTSGPSGHVNLAGDYIFVDGGFSKDPAQIRYPVKQAIDMGLCKSGRVTGGAKYSVVTTPVETKAETRNEAPDNSEKEESAGGGFVKNKTTRSLFDRSLKLFSDGRFGHIVLVDENEPGKLSTNPKTLLKEFIVQDTLIKNHHHRFGQDHFLREYTRKEETFEALFALGHAKNVANYTNIDTFQHLLPVRETVYEKSRPLAKPVKSGAADAMKWWVRRGRRLILLALNLISTALTLFTGLRENPLVVFVTGRYDRMRSRLIDGAINYEAIRPTLFRPMQLEDLTEVGRSYRFFSAPDRFTANVGEDRSTCQRVNSINTTVINICYDDFWGKAARRTQTNLYSISAANCAVINFKPAWVTKCVEMRGATNATACHEYMLQNFEALAKNRLIQVGIESDYGTIGAVYLKCFGRPEKAFAYKSDMMVHQNYWAGGKNYIMFHTSNCHALPLVRDANWEFGLFQAKSDNDRAVVVGALDTESNVTTAVTLLYGVISIALILRGIYMAIAQSAELLYIPKSQRFLQAQHYLRYIAPFMPVLTSIPQEETSVIRFKGSILMGSDVWMNHWLYILISIVDSVVNIRLTYIIFQTGTWMLSKQVNFENFLFLCSALTKMTWLMCCVHSAIRWGMRVVIRGLKSVNAVRPALREKLEWYVDASAMFLSYKLYSILLFVLLYFFVVINGNTTFMVRQVPPKQGVFGGDPNIAQFWRSELTCDFFVILATMTFIGYLGGSLALLTRYKYATRNKMMQLLQRRYVFVGWDSMVAMEALGIDPLNPELVVDGVAATNCTLGSLLRQLYVSGPSGFVAFAGDYIFEEGGFTRPPVVFTYPIKQALALGLCKTNRHSQMMSKYTVSTMKDESEVRPRRASAVDPAFSADEKCVRSLFDRRLLLYPHGRYGKILLVDETEPGKVQKNSSSALMEYAVQDALSYMTILDIKPLMGNEKKLHIR